MRKTNRNLIIWAIAVLCILLIPKIAMQYTDEVNWSSGDFLIMGSLLFAMGLIYELISKKSEKVIYRIALAISILAAFLLFWVNAAVGIIGSEDQPANLLFGAVLLVGIIGALITRFKARGMFKTLAAAGTLQMVVPVLALLIWPPSVISWSPSVLGVFLLCAFFAFMFLISALLFRHSSMG